METPCQEWPKSRNKSGHGREWDPVEKRLDYAHRLAWRRAHGGILAGLEICHKCDNPPCVNVDHLFLGTHLDNQRDMAKKGRSRKQELCSKGHPMVPNSRGHYCRICHNGIANRARDERRRNHGERCRA